MLDMARIIYSHWPGPLPLQSFHYLMERVDDNDLRIQFTPAKAWWKTGVASEYNHSTHGSSTVGAEMTFQFRGTKIDVYGTITSNLVSAKTVDLFIVDGEEPVSWTASPQKQPVYNQKMFSSPTLQDGTHSLTMRITVNGSNTYFDYLEFMPSPNPPPSSSSLPPFPSTTSSEAGDISAPTISIAPSSSGSSSHFPASTDVSSIATTAVSASSPSSITSSAIEAGRNSSSLPPSEPSESSSHLSSATLVGISVAATGVVVSVMGLLIWRCLVLRRRRQTSSTSGLVSHPAISQYRQTPMRGARRSFFTLLGPYDMSSGRSLVEDEIPKDPPPPYSSS
ncbi:hypothetical protein E1B28_010794 [Marasmius oreades]|uniref:Uncharacterized protein n=1 Tax=Marasmius oreades TaxID=181124 RepID=A0A9P7RSW0_9AGAR|nr:uncharacterized protein E1B28_010794 [Marasmius oreades]KAG7089085.1 hypothetical protein E1B28_010794 [Marasmius oreades]